MSPESELKAELKKSLDLIIKDFKKVAAKSDKAQYNLYYNGQFDAFSMVLYHLGFSIKEIEDIVLEALNEAGL